MQIRKKGDEILKKIFSSESTEPISTLILVMVAILDTGRR
jgi:hypothetical protein